MAELAPGLIYFPEFFDRAAQQLLVADLREIVRVAPLFTARMPRTGAPWPAIPELALRAWRETGGFIWPPQACLVNFYDAAARMGLHQDRDEEVLDAPVVSISLGDSCLFRFGGRERGGKTRSVRLHSGDVVVLGGASRLAFHGVDRIMPGTSTLLPAGGRVNLTLRRVTPR